MTALRYKGPPDSLRLGTTVVKIGDTISASDELTAQLLKHPGFEAIAKTPKPSKASKKQKPKPSEEVTDELPSQKEK